MKSVQGTSSGTPCDIYLLILLFKKLLGIKFEKIFEISRDFRRKQKLKMIGTFPKWFLRRITFMAFMMSYVETEEKSIFAER